jgi:hypothetical protein
MSADVQRGSTGEDVARLQRQLTALGYDVGWADGDFGAQTHAAVVAYQQQRGLSANGVVGADTWAALDSDAGTATTAALAATDAARQSVIAYASAEVGLVRAKAPGNDDGSGRHLRQGWDHLRAYFNEAAPSLWSDDVVCYYDGNEDDLPSWCGIFALWALRCAGVRVGTWVMGSGISAVSGLRPTHDPQPGDVGYFEAHQHHCIVAAVDGDAISTIDGNSGGDGEVLTHNRSRYEFAAFYTPFA